MKIRYYYHKNYSTKLEMYLQKTNIKYRISGKETRSPDIIFDIWSTDQNSVEHMCALKELGISAPIVFAEYSASEYAKADYLMMRPKSQSVEIVKVGKSFRYRCQWVNSAGTILRRHEEQIGEIYIAKEPDVRKSTAFWSEDTGFSVLFTSKRATEIIRDSELKGIEFQRVKLSGGQYSENIFQMTSHNTITQDCIGTEYAKMVEVCPCCGKEQFYFNNSEQLHVTFSKLPAQSDLYMTEAIFGQGDPTPLFVISQRFYQLLKANNLARNVVFTPVVDVSVRAESL